MRDSSHTGFLPILFFLVLNFVSESLALIHEEGGEVEHYEVFHVEWERVEVPYVIGLWILTTTLVKLGRSTIFLLGFKI